PAQSFYQTKEAFYNIVNNSPISEVIFFCNSSRGRGPRVAGWFADHLKSQNNIKIKSLVLIGGVKEWMSSGSEYVTQTDGYNKSKWISS
ncbi:hypothetical protein V1514DRAFT_286607, partial [Lipomyces japonicus]|uniref:uncharacterized protein n=1 Tax=Lipomyces japonicus TaxID=56871 RepID=UPI0034CF093A